MSGVKALAWTSDSKKIALVGSGKNKFGRVISIDTGTDVGEISGVSATLMTVDVRPCRPFRVVAGGDEYSLKYYEGPPFKFGHSKKTHTNFINQIRYSPSGDHYVSVGSDRRIVLYDKDGVPVKEHENAHDGGIYGCGWTSSLEFVTGSADGTVRYWKVEGDTMVKLKEVPVWEEKKTLDHFIVGLACHEATVYVLCLNGEIKEIVEGKVTRKFDGWKGRLAAVLALHEKSLLLADSCGKVFTTDVEDRSLRRESSIPGV
jgi:WD40 repeat protein